MTDNDLKRLRELAKKQIELANTPVMEQLKKDWVNSNDCVAGTRPMVTIELWTFNEEVVPNFVQCESEEARAIEQGFLYNFLNHELFGDDQVVKDYYPVTHNRPFNLFGINAKRLNAGNKEVNTIGYAEDHPIVDLEDDFHKLQKSTYSVDTKATYERIDMLNELFGDILPVKLEGNCIPAMPNQKIVSLMGMETMLFSMYDYPELYKKMMEKAVVDYTEWFRFLEKNNAVVPTTGGGGLSAGSLCYTNKLPATANKVNQVWGYMDSQETVSISPQMFGEFVFPYYKQISDQFAALSYGCCEPVDPIWDDYLSKLENLRKVSISPWCKEEVMGEKLKGKPIVYQRKPDPTMIGVNKILDEDLVIQNIAKTCKAAKGCTLEITQRDVYTIHNDYSKVKRYIELIKQTIENNW
jgi:hypothetical protein